LTVETGDIRRFIKAEKMVNDIPTPEKVWEREIDKKIAEQYAEVVAEHQRYGDKQLYD
jgi:hypothetical protein